MSTDQPYVWTIPLLPAGSVPAALMLPTRTISAENWAYLHEVLDAMRPGLVTRDVTPHAAGGDVTGPTTEETRDA